MKAMFKRSSCNVRTIRHLLLREEGNGERQLCRRQQCDRRQQGPSGLLRDRAEGGRRQVAIGKPNAGPATRQELTLDCLNPTLRGTVGLDFLGTSSREQM